MINKRKDQEYRSREAEKDRQRKQQKRADVEYKNKEKENKNLSRKKRRQDADYSKKEAELRTTSRRKKRQDVEYSKKETEARTSSRRKRRQDVEYSEKEAELRTTSRRKRRQDVEYSEKEAELRTTSRRKRRQDVEYSEKEAELRTKSRRKRRQDVEYSEKEAELRTTSRRKRRQDVEYSEKEAELRTTSRRKRRQDVEYSKKETEAGTSSRKKKRQDVQYKKKESLRETKDITDSCSEDEAENILSENQGGGDTNKPDGDVDKPDGDRKQTKAKYSKGVSNTDQNLLKETCDDVNEDELNDAEEMEEFNNVNDNVEYRRRKRGHILRPVHFNADKDAEKFYRELIMLYYPWRDEERLKEEKETYEERYAAVKTEIDDCREKFEPYAEALCEGVWHDLTINLDTSDGLINGASCIIKKIDIPSDKSLPYEDEIKLHKLWNKEQGAHYFIARVYAFNVSEEDIFFFERQLLVDRSDLGSNPGPNLVVRSFMKSMCNQHREQKVVKCKMNCPEHSKQLDGCICGVYTLMFAEKHPQGVQCTNITTENLQQERKKIAVTLLQYSDILHHFVSTATVPDPYRQPFRNLI
ncbi:hypothetical protein KUTeg_018661 [Tegillarca granosa]|uniref:Uncharacterized protein n=1 Tax=Tegillarca granosa TaxID=220873 RepID=A0ABQ9EEK9_TEGGR|nr:hypothetical protein KUTeg_018661 [Tegillarca granosa]